MAYTVSAVTTHSAGAVPAGRGDRAAVVAPTAGEAPALPADVAPTPGHVASIGGIQNLASNLAGAFGATIVCGPLVLSGGLALLGAFSYLVIVGSIEPLPPLTK